MVNFYVSPTGNGAVTGLDPANPTTLDHANTIVNPGDTVLLYGGTYNRTTGLYPKQGTANNWITFQNFDSTPPILTATFTTDDLVHFLHPVTTPVTPDEILPQYVEIRGLTFNGNNLVPYGVFVQGSSYVRVIGCTFINMGIAGLASKFSDYYYVANNLFYHNGYGAGWGSAISLNSHLWTNLYTGFHSFVLNNIIAGTFDGSANHTDGNGIIMDLSHDTADPTSADTPPVLILNNVVYENGGAGILVYVTTNIWVVNNTCYANGLDPRVLSGQSGNFVTNFGQNSFFINNVSQAFTGRYNYERRGISPLPGSNTYFDDMYFGGLGNNFSNTELINNNPLFKDLSVFNPANDNQGNALPTPWNLGTALQLQLSSPAAALGIDPTTLSGIDANIISGLQAYVYTDINGVIRPVGGPFSLGAYQVTPIPATPPRTSVFLGLPTLLGGPAFGKPRMFPQLVTPAAPAIFTVTPNSAVQGDTLDVALTGVGFTPGSVVNFGPGITVNVMSFSNSIGVMSDGVYNETGDPSLNFESMGLVGNLGNTPVNGTIFTSSTDIAVNITIAPGAPIGLHDVTVTNPDGQVGRLIGGFTVISSALAPTVTSATANSGVQGQTLPAVVILGANFVATPTVSFGADITVNSVIFTDSTHLSVSITIDPAATLGARTVTVTNPDLQVGSAVAAFTVLAPAPTVTSSFPNSGRQGDTIASVLVGGTFFVATPTVSFGTGITVNTVTWNSATQLDVSITIDPAATAGVRTITVTNPDTQVGTLVAGFTVLLAAPTVTSVTANTGGQGVTLPTVTIVGTFFVATPTVSFGLGITVNSVTFTNATQLSVSITIAVDADVGTRNVTVTNPDTQVGTLVAGFTVTATAFAPTVTSVTPNSGPQGQALTGVVIVGTHFVATPTVSFGAGITVSSVVWTNATHLSVNLIIDAGATVGLRNVTVTNPDLQFGTATSAFTVTAAAPVVLNAAPPLAQRGQCIPNVIVTGNFFKDGATITFGLGITVNFVAFNSSTQLTVNLTVAVDATLGARTVTVTNPDGQSGSL